MLPHVVLPAWSAPSPKTAIEIERAHYDTIKDNLLREHEGKFALIVGTDLIGVYDNPDEAYKVGIGQFGNVPMLIQPIVDAEPTGSAPALMLGLIGANP